jgi:hypothetical protein
MSVRSDSNASKYVCSFLYHTEVNNIIVKRLRTNLPNNNMSFIVNFNKYKIFFNLCSIRVYGYQFNRNPTTNLNI